MWLCGYFGLLLLHTFEKKTVVHMSLFVMLLEQTGFTKSETGLVNRNAPLIMTLGGWIAVLGTHATRMSITFT